MHVKIASLDRSRRFKLAGDGCFILVGRLVGLGTRGWAEPAHETRLLEIAVIGIEERQLESVPPKVETASGMPASCIGN